MQATRLGKTNALSHEQASLLIESFLRFRVQETTVPLMQSALDLRDRFQISYWDAAIIEAARLAECRTVLTEDLNDGQDFSGVIVENPFRQLA